MGRVGLALSLLAAGSLAVSVAVAAGEQPQPTLRVVGTRPLQVRGINFKSTERVKVTLYARTRKVRRMTATGAGRFTASFGELRLSHCSGLFIRAVGSRGSVATTKIPRPACMPVHLPR